MQEDFRYEFTKSGKTLLLFGILFVVIGISIDNYIFIIPGVFFLMTTTSLLVNFFLSRKLNFKSELYLSKKFIRSRGLVAVLVSLENFSQKTVYVKISLNVSYHFMCIEAPDTLFVKLDAMKKTSFVWILLAVRRGNGQVGPVELSLGPFQFFFKNARILHTAKNIKILPQKPRVSVPWKTKKELLLKMVNEYAQRIKGRGDEFFALREYLPGDEVKHIDWYATARQDKLITKEFEDERNLHFLVFLDLGSTMFGPKFEYALSSAVELSSLIKGTNHDLAVIAYSDMVKKFIVPQIGKNELRLMLNLYDLEATGVQSNFLKAVEFTKTNLLFHSIAIIFSDLEGNLKRKLQGLHLLQSMGSRVIFVNFSTMNFNILASSDWILNKAQDLDYRQIIEHVFPSLVEDEYSAREKEVRNILRSVGGDYIQIKGYEDNIILSLYRLMRKYSPTQRVVQEALGR
ncbi:MAG: DUF58 domain-containing protein [Candidatus Heimdallarchaeaceae archaeon]